jgi:hypothetical protein
MTSAPASNFLDLLAECRWDVRRFALDVLGVNVHAGQGDLLDLVLARLDDGYSPAYLTTVCSAGNRAGKTLGLAICVAHSTLYKMGVRPPEVADESDLKRWSDAPYDWYHFAMQQDTAELLLLELQRLMQGIHPAQKGRGCPLTDNLGPDVAEWDRKERGDWGWFKWSPLFGGGEVHFRTTSEKALGTLGRDMNGWSWDEAAFDPNLLFVYDEVLNLRRMSTGGQAVLIGTATEGSHQYEDLWERGDPLAPDRQPDYMSLRMSTRQNIGYGISQSMFDRMIRTVPPTLVPQNIDGYFIEARAQYLATEAVNRVFDIGLKRELAVHTPAAPGRRYAHGLDPALTYDSTWSVVLDITDSHEWVGVHAARRTGRQTAESIVGLAYDINREYNAFHGLTTGIDATGFGGKVFRSLLTSASVPATPVEFGGRSTSKIRLLNNMRSAVESGRIVLPKEGIWLELRRQMLGYKVKDRGLPTDAVMALVVAIRMALRALAVEGRPVEFDYFGGGQGLSARKPGVDSGASKPHRYVDDRLARLGTLPTATVASMGNLFRKR